MVDEYCGFTNEVFSILLDAYQMTKWDLTWEEYIEQARQEINERMDKWKLEPVDEDE